MASSGGKFRFVQSDRLDTVINEIDFGFFHILMIFGLGSRIYVRGSTGSLAAIMEPYLKCKFDLPAWMASTYLVIYFLTSAFSSWANGLIADKYGKRKTILLLCSMTVTLGILHALSNSFAMITITRAAYGLFQNAQYFIYPYLMETLPKSKKHLASMLEVFLIIGFASAVLITDFCLKYLSWQWAVFFTYILPVTIAIMTLLVIPESPRYLISINDKKGAVDSLVRIAKLNRCKSSREELSQRYRQILFETEVQDDMGDEESSEDALLLAEEKENAGDQMQNKSECQLTKADIWRRVMMVCITTFLNQWFRSALMYGSGQSYGMDKSKESCTQCTDSVQVAHLLSVSSGMALSLIAAYNFLRLFKRRLILLSLMTSLAIAVTPFHFAISDIISSLTFFVSSSITETVNVILLVYASEVVPTSVRGISVGTISTAGTIGKFTGTLFASYVLHLNGHLSLLVMHALIVVCITVIYFFAEGTKDMSLS